jgi:hypothetical protein
MHELDTFMEQLRINTDKGLKRKKSSEYNKIANRMKYMKKKGLDKTNLTEYKTLMKKLTTTHSMKHDDEYIRI